MFWKVITLSISITGCFAGKGEYKDETDQKFQDQCLKEHNKHRAKHHSPDLQLDEKCVEHAKERCQVIAKLKKDEKAPAPSEADKEFGENRYWGSSTKAAPCSEGVDNWYGNSKHYDYKKHEGKNSFGFTQLIWKDTKSVGCARCVGKEEGLKKTHIICTYKPRGNYKQKYKENILKP